MRLCTNMADRHIRQKLLKISGENDKTAMEDFNKLWSLTDKIV